MSWDPNSASASRPSGIEQAVWSPCGSFIAIAWGKISTIDVLDSVTLQRLQSFKPPQSRPTYYRALVFSPDGRILTYNGIPSGDDHGICVSSWDLQTGGLVRTIRLQVPGPEILSNHSIAHSVNGGIVGVFHWDFKINAINIFIYDASSGACIHSHTVSIDIPLSYNIETSDDIWTHGESFRFATAHPATVTIWEVGFTSGATCKEVETLRIPVDLVYEDLTQDTHGRPHSPDSFAHTFGHMILLAYRVGKRIWIWDVRNSKYLLDWEDPEPYGSGFFEFFSDGRFFVCAANASTGYIWKESPTGYVLHRILPSGDLSYGSLLSPNGESMITCWDLVIKLWRTREITASPSGASTVVHQHLHDSVLDFSPDGKLAVVAAHGGDTVVVLNLESGVPQLTINSDMKVRGLRVIGNTVVVMGMMEWSHYSKVISWNLPAGEYVPDDGVDCKDSARTVDLGGPGDVSGATISSDCRYVAVTTRYSGDPALHTYCASTGGHLHTVETSNGYNIPWFTPDGSHVWCVTYDGEAEAWRVGERGRLERLELAAEIEHPPEGYPWRSSRGYRITDDWWILSPDGKRLLMLPPHWRSYPVHKVWKGKFLALLDRALPEPVILEMEP